MPDLRERVDDLVRRLGMEPTDEYEAPCGCPVWAGGPFLVVVHDDDEHPEAAPRRRDP